jgi:hypothetical protein
MVVRALLLLLASFHEQINNRHRHTHNADDIQEKRNPTPLALNGSEHEASHQKTYAKQVQVRPSEAGLRCIF